MSGVPHPANRVRLFQGLLQVVVDAARPVLPVIPLVIRLRTQLEVLWVDAQAVMAAVSDHLILPDDSPLQDAVDEPVGVSLTSVEHHFPGVIGVRDDAALGRAPPLCDE